MTIKHFVLGAVLSASLFGGVFSFAQSNNPVTPSKEWLTGYDDFTRRNAALAAAQKKNAEDFQQKHQAETDSLVGMSQRLVGQIPQGYQFDPKLRIFIPIPAAPAPAPAKPAVTPETVPTPTPEAK